MTRKIIALAKAIEEFEGWYPLGPPGSSDFIPSVSYRNHNPGNLKSSPFSIGERDGFAVFENYNIGFFALVWDIWKKCKGETSSSLTPDSSLFDFILVFSGEDPSVVSSYSSFISTRLDLPSTTPIKELLK